MERHQNGVSCHYSIDAITYAKEDRGTVMVILRWLFSPLLLKIMFFSFRYLYMRKLVFAKLLYLAVLVFLFHIFLFIVVPEITQR